MGEEWPTAGVLLSLRYRLAKRLATSGMSEIWRADDGLLGRAVAIKLPKPQVSEILYQAWIEARTTAKLSDPHIAAVHDYGEALRPDGSTAPFVVMELLAGESLAARLTAGPLIWQDAARIGAEVAAGLATAHARRVVHRDIKPGNIMLTPTGTKILDFGISVVTGAPDDDETGVTFGTPAYVAPERLNGTPAQPATDVYALGAVLFEMINGEPPYPVDTWEEYAAARTATPKRLPDELPPGFRKLVDRCLTEDPRLRPAATDVRDRLAALRAAALSSAALSSSPAGVGESGSPAGVGSAGESRRPADVPSLGESRSPADVPSSAGVGSAGESGSPAAARSAEESRSPAAPPLAEESQPGGSGAAEVAQSPTGGPQLSPSTAATIPGLIKINFAGRPSAGRPSTGRTPVRTVAPVGRRMPAPVRVAIVVLLLVAVGAVIGLRSWSNDRTDTPKAAPNSSEPPPAPTTPPATTTPPAVPTSTAAPSSATAEPTGGPTLGLDEAVDSVIDAVHAGQAAGHIRDDVAVDLLNLLRQLSNAPAKDVSRRVAELQQKIRDRTDEGSLARTAATELQNRLNRIARV